MRILSAILFFALLLGCAATKKAQTPSKVAAHKMEEKSLPAGQFDESFDPLTLEDDDITIRKQNNLMQKQADYLKNISTATSRQNIPDSLKSYKEVDGFRIQVFAGRDIQAATMAETKAKEDFEKKGLKVYLIFEAPFYKVRVGDFTDRNEAENARDLAKRLGYKSAFVARSKVKVVTE